MNALASCGLVAALLLADARLAAAAERHADVVVYGGTASGIIAAVAAAREGKKVILIEPGRHLGGMVSGGLGATDFGNRAAIGGYAREFFDRVREHYVKTYGANSEQVKACSDGFHFEPHVAERVLHEMIAAAKVEVLLEQHRLVTVAREEKRIAFIVTQTGKTFDYPKTSGKVFIDASYEGDLMAAAKVSYTVGREGRERYRESLAGVQEHSRAHQWPVPVAGLDAQGKLLPYIQTTPPGQPGQGDRKTQAYNFRLCMTDRPDNRVPFPKPAHYDPNRYELLARLLATKPDLKVGQLMNPVRMPNGKTDTNNNGPFSTDHIGANWDYPEGDQATRARIWQDHLEYTQGFLYFLANDSRVPRALHDEMARWGLAKDEFVDTANWPHQLYVREARRMLGSYVMTQTDIMENRTKDDAIALGSYNTDSHHVQRVLGADGNVVNEGDFQVPVQPYAIPYRSLTPKAGECDNLLVTVCMSASHVAYGTIRMEPVYMIMGQAAGVAGAQAADNGVAVQKIDVDKLLARLKARKAVLSPLGLSRPGGAGKGIDAAKLGGIVVDDVGATKTGAWVFSTSTLPFVGAGYVHDNNTDKGRMRVRFTPSLTKTGRYEVRLFYPAHANRATKVPVVIHYQDGEKMTSVDQRKPLRDEQPLSLGTLAFAAGTSGWVEIRNDDTDGFVVADAVQWVEK
jgi:hypothetical protein